MNILLVDDHAIVADGIESLLSGAPDMQVVGKAASGLQALDVLREKDVDLVITDYSMGGGMDGLVFVSQIRKNYPETRIIVLSMHDEPSIIQEVLKAGVDGYVLKKYTHHELITAVNVIKEGGQFWSPEINKILLGKLQPDAIVQITEREMEVLKLLANGHTSKEIAAILFISDRTVETHRKNLLRKTDSSNVAGLLKYAHSNKLI